MQKYTTFAQSQSSRENDVFMNARQSVRISDTNRRVVLDTGTDRRRLGVVP